MSARVGLEAGALLDVRMRLAVELGRVRMPLARAVALPEGELIDLDRHADEPVEVYVNGLHFGTGRLHLIDGEWALKLDQVDSEQGDGTAGAGAQTDVEQASSERSAGLSEAE